MSVKLRILFTILSAICLGLAIPVGAMIHFIWAIVLGLGALLFFLLMLVCKQEQEKKENAQNPKDPSFFNPSDKKETERPTETDDGEE